jgi:uncharacterized protein (TIGR03083 family)
VDEDDVVPWFRDGMGELLTRLRATPPATPIWTPLPGGTAAWWTRKMVVETAIHRWDAAMAFPGSFGPAADPVPTAVAGDGIDEFIGDFVIGLLARAKGERPYGRIELVATDAPLGWCVDLGGESRETTSVEGTASDVLLWLWNRLPRPLDQLTVSGDSSLVEGWRVLKI